MLIRITNVSENVTECIPVENLLEYIVQESLPTMIMKVSLPDGEYYRVVKGFMEMKIEKMEVKNDV